jgi:hypothetical protein
MLIFSHVISLYFVCIFGFLSRNLTKINEYIYDHIHLGSYKIHTFWRHFFSSLFYLWLLSYIEYWLCECSRLKDRKRKTQKCKKQKHASRSSHNHKDRQVQNTTRQLMMLLVYPSLYMKCCLFMMHANTKTNTYYMGQNSCKWKARR